VGGVDSGDVRRKRHRNKLRRLGVLMARVYSSRFLPPFIADERFAQVWLTTFGYKFGYNC
jgi:hypothetical protein